MSQPSFTAIVDDRDPLLQYTGGWFRTGTLEDYNHTSSNPLGNDCKVSLAFVGTDVGVYTTLLRGQGNSSSGFQFILDGVDVSFFSATNDMLTANASKHVEAFTLTGLSNTQHTLSFTAAIGSDSPPGLFFDYILYNTSTIPNGNATLFFDDTSSQIQYDSNWHTVSTSSNPLSRTLMNTTHDANGSGADSTFTFPFSGTGISIYGQIPNTDSITPSTTTRFSFSIDSQPSGNSTIRPNPPNGQLANTLFYQSPPGSLQQGDHSLVLTVPNGAPFALDYILVEGWETGVRTTQPQGHRGSSNVGAIAGAVVGGLMFLLFGLVLLWWVRRRRRRRSGAGEWALGGKSLPSPSQLFVKPFDSTTNSRDALTVVENGTPSETALTMVTRTTASHDRKRPIVDNRTHRESAGVSGGMALVTPMAVASPNLPVIPAGSSQPTLPFQATAASRNFNAYEEISDQSTMTPAESPVADSHIRFPRDENGTTVPPPAYTLQ